MQNSDSVLPLHRQLCSSAEESLADTGSQTGEECVILQEKLRTSQVTFTASYGTRCLVLLVTGVKTREQQNRDLIRVLIVILFC